MEGQNNNTFVCTECCHDNPPGSSPTSKLYLTASGGSASIHGYLFNNIGRGVMQSLSPLARGKIGQRHLVCKHRYTEGLLMRFTQTVSLALAWFIRHLFCRHIYSSFEYLGCRDYEKIAHRTIITIIIQSLTSVQDTYDLLLYGDTMSWENHIKKIKNP